MSRRRGIIVENSKTKGFRLLALHGGDLQSTAIECEDRDQLPDKLSDLLERDPPTQWDFILAPAARSTLAVPLAGPSTATALPRHARANVGFMLEEYVPWSEEEFTYWVCSEVAPTFAILIRNDDWLPALNAIRDQGHRVDTIIPQAVLQGRGITRAETPQSVDRAYLLANGEGLHYFTETGDNITQWRFWPLDGSSLSKSRAELIASELAALSSDIPCSLYDCPESLASVLSAAVINTTTDVNIDEQRDESIWAGAESLWSRPSASINLSAGVLTGSTLVDSIISSVKTVCHAVAALLLVATIALVWKGRQYQQLVNESREKQVELYKTTFPGSEVPLALTSRFDSQYRSIAGQRVGTETVELPQPAISALRAILTAHRGPVRSRFEEVVITNKAVELECEFRSHADASRIVDALEEAGVAVEPPQLQTLDGQTIGARLRGKVDVAAAKRGNQ